MASSVLEGCRELLVEVVAGLDQASINNYIIIGGWCPYLRNASAVHHPGTYDVDVLFQEGNRNGALASAIATLLERGFAPSAKHPFQLLTEKKVNGNRLIYNVDLLHPRMSETDKGMFVDHLELDIPLDDEERRLKIQGSVVLPNSEILFKKGLFSRFTMGSIHFNLVDFTGMFITKMDSCQKQKRERDALDLYIAVKSAQVSFETLTTLRAADERVRKSLDSLLAYLDSKGEEFDNNVALFAKVSESPASVLAAAMRANVK